MFVVTRTYLGSNFGNEFGVNLQFKLGGQFAYEFGGQICYKFGGRKVSKEGTNCWLVLVRTWWQKNSVNFFVGWF
jgi:hypothetical protein